MKLAGPPSPELPEPLTGAEIQALIRAHAQRQAAESGEEQMHLSWYRGGWGTASGAGTVSRATDPEGAPPGEYVETNYPYAYVDTMVSNVVPPKPAVTINARDPKNDQAARNREGLVAEVFEQNQLHSKLWRAASLTSIIKRSFLKLAWDATAKRVKIRVLGKQFVYFDEGAESWDEIGYIIEAVPVTKKDFERRVKKGTYDKKVAAEVKWSGYPSWLKDGQGAGAGPKSDDARDVFQWTVVYEVYDFRGRAFYHVLADHPEPLFAVRELPYRWLDNPYALLVFTDDLEGLGGISDTKLIATPLNQLNECDTLDLNNAKTGFPVLFFDSGKLNNVEEIKSAWLSAGEPGAAATADVKQGFTLDQAMRFSPVSTIPLNMSRLQARLEDKIAFTLAMSGYQRGNVGESSVATAYALTNEALQTSNGKRQKQIYDLIEWAARGVIALHEQFMPGDESLWVRLAGRQDRVQLTRQSLGFVSPSTGGRPLEFDYDVVPYSALESNKLVQTRQIEQFWPALQWGVAANLVDAKALMVQLLDLVGLQNVGTPQATTPAQIPPLPNLNLGSESGGTKGVPGLNAEGTPTRAAPIPLPAGGPGSGGSATE